MLRVESNTDIRGFTEFEEDILFDKDDPDFDHQLPALPTFVIEDTNNANVYKWMAIITDAKCNLDGLVTKIRAYSRIKVYIEKALELNPDDMVILYMLGKWCYEMARLTWLQRIIASTLYESPPHASYEEAFEYLHRAADLQNKDYYIPTFYVLGKTCIKLKQFFRARYYLNTAACLPPRTRYEEKCAKKSKQLLAQLEKYDVDKECILSDCPFGAGA